MRTRRGWRRLAAAALLAAAGCAPRGPGASAPGDTVAAVAVSGAWARPSPAGATVGAAYLTLESVTADRLLEASVSPAVAERVEMHEVVTGADGAMSMQPVDAIDLPAGTRVTLRPGSHHVMLLGLARPLVRGDTVALALRFERAPRRTVAVPVREDSGP